LILSLLQGGAVDALPEVAAGLKDKNEEIRNIAHLTAYRLGEAAAPLQKLLIESLASSFDGTAGLAAMTLAGIPSAGREFFRALQVEFNVRPDGFKEVALYSLRIAGQDCAEAREMICDGLDSGNPKLVLMALSAIPVIESKDPELRQRVAALRKHEDKKLARLAKLMIKSYFDADPEED
jgi:hypothetical protein